MTKHLQVNEFNLGDTLECGQFFRFTKLLNTYLVQSSDKLFSVFQQGNNLYYDGVEESFLIRFFRLDEDLNFILKEIDQDPMIHQAIRRYRGMRLIRQDPWECLLSFLCSSAKAISHIRFILEILCKSFGKKIYWNHYIGYGFPELGGIKESFQLEAIKAGFRTAYLIKASQQVNRTYLLSLKELSYQEARERLMRLSGVGKKVADCILLYSLDFLEAFPMDTWIKKGLQKIYFKGERVGVKSMEEFVSHHFGPYAGYAQLYLYHFWRNDPSKISPSSIH